jgi:hypothetical protein
MAERPEPSPFPQAGEGNKKNPSVLFASRKIPSPIPMGAGKGEGNFIVCG